MKAAENLSNVINLEKLIPMFRILLSFKRHNPFVFILNLSGKFFQKHLKLKVFLYVYWKLFILSLKWHLREFQRHPGGCREIIGQTVTPSGH